MNRRVTLWASITAEGNGDAPLEGAAEATVSGIEYASGDPR